MMKKHLYFSICCVFCSIHFFTPAAAQHIESSPSGAKVYYEGTYLGKTPLNVNTEVYPQALMYQIRRDQADVSKPPYVYVLTLKMDGYEDQTVRVVGEWKYISQYSDLNCTVAPKSWKLSAIMEKKESLVLAEQAPDIHWGIDSDPSGARVFWRVVSSIPSIVKNTDYMYLGASPIDLKKPLNINGLTADNARYVNIEIKIQSKGYKPETKSFSAELLTEQKEISWFFELFEE